MQLSPSNSFSDRKYTAMSSKRMQAARICLHQRACLQTFEKKVYPLKLISTFFFFNQTYSLSTSPSWQGGTENYSTVSKLWENEVALSQSIRALPVNPQQVHCAKSAQSFNSNIHTTKASLSAKRDLGYGRPFLAKEKLHVRVLELCL